MNISAVGWALTCQTTRPSDKLLLICLAHRADKDGKCFPRQKSLAAQTGLDRKTVIASLRRLRESGHITDEGLRSGTTNQVVIYQLSFTQPISGDAQEPETVPDLGYYTENGTVPKTDTTVPFFPRNSPENGHNGPVFPEEQSLFSSETVPKTGHGISKKESTKKERKNIYIHQTTDAAMQIFWPLYPRKIGKDAARKKLQEALQDATIEEIVWGLQHYEFCSDPKYQPHAARWLNEGRWKIEEDTPVIPPPNYQPQSILNGF